MNCENVSAQDLASPGTMALFRAFGSCLNPVTMTSRGGERSRHEIGAREIFSCYSLLR